MSWDSLFKSVSGVAGAILTDYASRSDADAEASFSGELSASTFTGDVEWGQDRGGAYVAINRGDREALLTFTRTPSDGEPASSAFALAPGYYAEVTEELNTFRSGAVCVGKTQTESGDAAAAGGGRLLSVAYDSLGLKSVATITDGLTITYEKTVEGRAYFKLTSNVAPDDLWKLSVDTTDGQGAFVTVRAELTEGNSTGSVDPDGEWEWTVELPLGIDLEPLVEAVKVEIELDDDAFQVFTAKSRERARRYR
jgi:hypothetical protein